MNCDIVLRPSARPATVKPAPPPVHFTFRKRYEGIYTNKHVKFLLREEHVKWLRQLVRIRKQNGVQPHRLLSMSDVVNAVLDFVFEHRIDLEQLSNPEEAKNVIAHAI